MQEIIRVTADRQTLYMRIPRMFKDAKKLKRGDYLVCMSDGNDGLKIRTWDDEIDGKTGT